MHYDLRHPAALIMHCFFSIQGFSGICLVFNGDCFETVSSVIISTILTRNLRLIRYGRIVQDWLRIVETIPPGLDAAKVFDRITGTYWVADVVQPTEGPVPTAEYVIIVENIRLDLVFIRFDYYNLGSCYSADPTQTYLNAQTLEMFYSQDGTTWDNYDVVMHLCVCVYVRMYVRMYIYIYVYIYICIYILYTYMNSFHA
jgi:hypothetical protein